MKKFWNWFKDSNRYKHFFGGVLIGLGADDVYCASYAGIGVASALELKDKLYGNEWDWIDWGCTVVGVAVGQALRQVVCSLL